MKKVKRVIKKRLTGKEYTSLTTDILKDLDFKNHKVCKFKLFENMGYWVKNGICLFYNHPVKKTQNNIFYIGYAEMSQGIYAAVAFRWIDSEEELVAIYESILNKKIYDAV